MWILAAATALAAGVADCPQTYETPAILEAADQAEVYFKAWNSESFQATRVAMHQRVQCTTDRLDPSTLARIHRVEALGAFLDKDEARLPRALAGLVVSEPGHQLPLALVPDAHPVREKMAYAATLLRADLGVPGPKLPTGWYEVDGSASDKLPAERAALVQQIDSQGKVVTTHYRWPDELGAPWVVWPAPAPEPRPAPAIAAAATPAQPSPVAARPTPWIRRGSLLGGAAVSIAAAAGMYLGASETRRQFDDSAEMAADAPASEKSSYREELRVAQAQANGLTAGYVAGAAVGVGLVVVAAVTW